MQLLSNVAFSEQAKSKSIPCRGCQGTFTELDFLSHPVESSGECEGHFLRLTNGVRRQRFNGLVDDGFIKDYVKARVRHCARVHAARFEGIVRGVAELHSLDAGRWRAEAAFSVEPGWQGLGVGTRLMARLVDDAVASGFTKIVLCCDPLNTRMLSICSRYSDQQVYEEGEYVVTLDLSHPVASLFTDTGDRRGNELRSKLAA
jgi:GNAT superfamily N-acetyltransferase